MSRFRQRVGALISLNPRLTAQTTLFNAARLGVGAIGSVLLARWLGPDSRGLLSAALLLPPLLLGVGGSGIARALFFFSGSARGARPQLAGAAVYLALVQSLLLFVAGYLIVEALFPSSGTELTSPANLYLATIPAGVLGAYCLQILLGAGEVKIYNWIGLLIPVGYLVATVALKATSNLTVPALVIALVLLNGCMSLLAVLALRRRAVAPFSFAPRDIGPRLVSILRYATRAFPGDAAFALNLRIDQLVIAAVLPPSQLAFYAVAVSIAAVLDVFPAAVSIVNGPLIAQQHELAARENLIRLTVRTLIRLALPMWIAAMLLLPVLTWLVLGEEWGPSLKPLFVLSAAGIVLGFKQVLVACATASGDPWLASETELVGLAVTACGLFFLIPPLGILGAALTSLLAYLASTAWIARGFRRRHGFKVFPVPGAGST